MFCRFQTRILFSTVNFYRGMAYLKAVKEGSEIHRKPDGVSRIEYGTAGFRTEAGKLNHVMYRIGIIAALRSKLKKATVGVMITASHNPEEDNGVKIIDPRGEMLESSWEVIATDFVNTENIEDSLSGIIQSIGVDIDEPANVFVGRDTRSSGEKFLKSVTDGVQALEGNVEDFGIVTTPELHYFVCCKNSNNEYGDASEAGYFQKLGDAFCKMQENEKKGLYTPKVRVDGSNGVGAQVLKKLIPYLHNYLSIEIYNNGSGALNHLCGADYVKIKQCPPEGMPLDTGVRCVSLDGDADRLIYFFICKSGQFKMLDGDKIAVLMVHFISKLLKESGLNLTLGLVQTAYANGSSTHYVRDVLKVPVLCVATGVKNLHHKAQQFDVGVYFEANGHGTVTFSNTAKTKIMNATKDDGGADLQMKSAKMLMNFIDIINETVGDAISDMLAVEAILHCLGWNIEKWNDMYHDLPNRQLKAKVKDRNMIRTTDDETRCIEPAQIQEEIDKLVTQYKSARAFVRPSGTENVVRVYAEAATQHEADELAQEVSNVVHCEANVL